MAVKAYTWPGESVLMLQPVYYPFREVIEDNGRKRRGGGPGGGGGGGGGRKLI